MGNDIKIGSTTGHGKVEINISFPNIKLQIPNAADSFL